MPLASRAASEFFFSGILYVSTNISPCPPGDRSGARRQDQCRVGTRMFLDQKPHALKGSISCNNSTALASRDKEPA